MDLVWKKASNGDIPPNAIITGRTTRNFICYVIRANHEGNLLPGKLLHSSRYALVGYNGQEIWKYQYEVLTGINYTWMAASKGNIPANAVVGGHTSRNETLYVGRNLMNYQPGNVNHSTGLFSYPLDSRVPVSENYEVLCLK